MDAIVFDFDGTLVDSEPLHGMALAEVCREDGLPFSPDEVVGVADADVIRRAIERARRPMREDHIERLLARKSALMRSFLQRDMVMPYPGAVELVHAAAARGPVGVCTAAMRSDAEFVLARLGLDDVLGVIVTVDDVSIPKPDPEGYLLAAERLKANPKRCVAIEDSPTGVAAAKSAGYRVVALAHTTPRELIHGADLYVDRIGQLTIEQLESLTP